MSFAARQIVFFSTMTQSSQPIQREMHRPSKKGLVLRREMFGENESLWGIIGLLHRLNTERNKCKERKRRKTKQQHTHKRKTNTINKLRSVWRGIKKV